MRILLVEDDVVLSLFLKTGLAVGGYAVDTAMDGEYGEFLGVTENYDAAILDLGLPKLSGLEVLRRWRAADKHLPVIVLTARDAWHEKVDGLKAGADDYLGKPFHLPELLARLQAVLKRAHKQNQASLSVDGVVLDEELQSVAVDGKPPVALTAIEFKLLRYFMLYSGKLLSKSHLLERVYDDAHDNESNVIEVYVNRLRRIIGGDLIQTRRGQGYMFGRKA